MPTQQNIVTQMTQALASSIPSLDTSIGSPIRSILDVVAEVISEQTADQYLISYAYDVDSMSSANLDAFVGIFGMVRYAAKRAVGFITLSRTTNTTQDMSFAAGTQVQTGGSPNLIFSTITPATMTTGTNSITVPIQASLPGSSGNVAANTITQPYSTMPGISAVTNLNGLTGGADAESDDQLRARFKSTVFRALTGTSSMYLATALEDPNVTQANVIGASETQNEQIQLVNGVGVSSVTNLAYLYANTAYFGVNIFNGDIFSPGVQYTLTSEFVPNPPAPSTSPTTGTGSLLAATYQYAISVTTIGGETALGTPASQVLTATGEITVSWAGLNTTVASTSNGVNVNTFNGSGTLNVASTAHFPSTGVLNVATGSGTKQVYYTGTTSTSFTGCSCSGSGVLSTGGAVAFADVLNYNVYRLVGGVFQLLATVNSTTLSYVDNGAVTPNGEAPVQNSTGTPIVRSLDSTNVPDGVYQLQYNYLSQSSRNDPANNLTNRIDIYVNGERPVETFQNLVYASQFIFNDTDPTTVEAMPTSMNVQLFERKDGTQPQVGNIFTPLAFSPIIDMVTNSNGPALNPATIGMTTWTEGTNFWVVNDVSQFGGSSLSRSGIEWGTPGPTADTEITFHYNFNQIPAAVQAAVENWRLVTTDVMVHQANNLYLDMYFSVVLIGGGFTLSSVLSQVETAVSNYLTSVGFSGVIQVSQILAAIQAIPGIVAVRFLNSADGYRTDSATYSSASSTITDASIGLKDEGSPVSGVGIPLDSYVGKLGSGTFTLIDAEGIAVNPISSGTSVNIGTKSVLYGTGPHNGSFANGFYAMQQVTPSTDAVVETFASTVGSPLRAVDVFLQDDQLAVLNNIYLVQQANNSFGPV